MRGARSLSGDEVSRGGGRLTSSPPPPDFESSSDAYAHRFAGSVGAWFLELQAASALALLRPLGVRRVLEVGGGHAQLTAPLVEAGYRVTVQGSSESCTVRLRRLFSEKAVPHVVSPLEQLPFGDRTFDAIVTIRMMAHVEDPARFVAECARVAGRAVLVDYPSKRSANFLADALFNWKRSLERDTRVYRCFDEREVSRLFESNGFRLAGEVRQFFWPMALHRAHKNADAGRALEAAARAAGLARWFGSPVLALYVR